MSSQQNFLSSVSATSSPRSTGQVGNMQACCIADHASLDAETTQRDATDMDPPTKRFLKIEDIWM